MGGSMFLLNQNDGLIELQPTSYDSESLLQGLLERHPGLLVGGQIDSEAPRRWLLIKREAGVAGDLDGGDRWYVDHLFLDQDGIPTLIEVKRSTDTRIRREVIGQMLDYAANAVTHWRVESIQASLEARVGTDGSTTDEVVAALLGPDADIPEFWQRVKTNLQAGRIRLIFVADVIPPELARVVEFLNQQMDPAEVLAIEVRRFAGEGVQSLVPRLLGYSEQAQSRRSGTQRSPGPWTEDRFFEVLAAKNGPVAADAVRAVAEWSRANGARLAFGRGVQDGSLYPIWDREGRWYNPAIFYTYGSVEIPFQYLKERPPFDSEDLRRELLARLNRIPGVSLPESRLAARPSIRLEMLLDGGSRQIFFEAMDWFRLILPGG